MGTGSHKEIAQNYYATNPRGMKLGILTEREGRSTLGALPEIPSRVREMERRVGHLGLGCLSV